MYPYNYTTTFLLKYSDMQPYFIIKDRFMSYYPFIRKSICIYCNIMVFWIVLTITKEKQYEKI